MGTLTREVYIVVYRQPSIVGQMWSEFEYVRPIIYLSKPELQKNEYLYICQNAFYAKKYILSKTPDKAVQVRAA